MTKAFRGWVLGLGMLLGSMGWAQPAPAPAAAPAPPVAPVPITPYEQPDARGTRDQLSNLLQNYPPALRGVLALDPGLLSNQPYLAPYPALANFLRVHPEIARNPSFYVGNPQAFREDSGVENARVWENMLTDVEVFAGISLALCLIAWLIRTRIDYRRWDRLSKVQTDAHTKLLDRFTSNDDLLTYMNSPAGSKFLESAPISLDTGPRSVSAPLGRILWTVQGGVVLLAVGVGLEIVSRQVSRIASQPLHVLGVLGMALGIGFLTSAIISFVIAHRLGLIEQPKTPAVQG